MNKYTVIIYCCCGCEAYELHHVTAKTPKDAPRRVKVTKSRTWTTITVLKGHCEEA